MGDYTSHTATASYAQSGFSNKMGWGSRPALIMVDVCTAYWCSGSPLDTSSNAESAASPESMRQLVAAGREGGCPIVWTQVNYEDAEMKECGAILSQEQGTEFVAEG